MKDADQQLAVEAERLRNDQPFAEAIKTLRKNAIEDLLKVDVIEQPNRARQLQANILAIDALCGEIAAQILRGTPQKKNPVA